jgi:hypothetical protein
MVDKDIFLWMTIIFIIHHRNLIFDINNATFLIAFLADASAAL